MELLEPGRAGPCQGWENASMGFLSLTYPTELEPRVIRQQQNQRKNNLLVLMGLVLSLPRTFQPGSRDPSGGGGDNEAKLFLVFKCQSGARRRWPGLAQLPGPGAAAGKWSTLGAQPGTGIFHSLAFVTARNAGPAGRAARGFAPCSCLCSPAG